MPWTHNRRPSSQVFKINDTACAEVAYLPTKEVIDLDLRLNGHVILEKDIDLRHLSKECVGVPYIKKAAELCAVFSKVEINTTEVGACVDITIELLGAKVLDAHVGCFHLHIPNVSAIPAQPPALVEEMDALA